MPRYLIERFVPHANDLTSADLKAIAEQRVLVQKNLAGQVQWIQSTFTNDKMVCLYVADDELALRARPAQRLADPHHF